MPNENEELQISVNWARGDWIVLSASCDVIRGDDTHVLLARVLEATAENLGAENAKVRKQRTEILRQGYDWRRFLLAPFDAATPAFPLSFAEYAHQRFLPLAYMRAHCAGQRLRLLSPFREKFGNWAAANLGRVGVEDSCQIPRVTGLSASAIVEIIDEGA